MGGRMDSQISSEVHASSLCRPDKGIPERQDVKKKYKMWFQVSESVQWLPQGSTQTTSLLLFIMKAEETVNLYL